MDKQHYIIISKSATLPADETAMETALETGAILVFKNWNLTTNNIAGVTETSDLTGEVDTVQNAKVGFQAIFRPLKQCANGETANIQALCEIIANPCNGYKYYAFLNIKNGQMLITTKFDNAGVATLYAFQKNLDPTQIFLGISNPAITLTDLLGEWTEGVSKTMITTYDLDETDLPTMRVVSLIKTGTAKVKVVDTANGAVEVVLSVSADFKINGTSVTPVYAAGEYSFSPAPVAGDIITVEDDNVVLYESLIY